MNLAVITSGFLPIPATKGGAVETLVVNLLNENEQKRKIDFTIFSIFDQKAMEESKKYNHTKFEFIKVGVSAKILDEIMFFIVKNILKKENSQSYRFIFQRLSFLNKVSKKLKKENYDKVLLENHPTQYLALKWRKNYIKYKDRYYYHCHNEFPGKYGCDEIIRNTNKIICVSQYISDTIQKYMEMPKHKFFVLRNSIDTKQFATEITKKEANNLKEKYNIRNEDKILLFTGRIVPEKGVKELIESLQNVKYDHYKLLILGSALNDLETKTKYQCEIEEIVKKVDEKIVFTGFIKYEDIAKYYAIADIATLPSIWDDPAPLTVIESLASGLPIITTNSGGIPEYAKDGSAIILERDDNLIENLSNEISKLLIDDNKRSEMSKICKTVSSDLTLENFYNNFCKCLEGDN